MLTERKKQQEKWKQATKVKVGHFQSFRKRETEKECNDNKTKHKNYGRGLFLIYEIIALRDKISLFYSLLKHFSLQNKSRAMNFNWLFKRLEGPIEKNEIFQSVQLISIEIKNATNSGKIQIRNVGLKK